MNYPWQPFDARANVASFCMALLRAEILPRVWPPLGLGILSIPLLTDKIVGMP